MKPQAMIEVDEKKVKDWTIRLLENSFGLINYDESRDEFEGQHSKNGIHPNCNDLHPCSGEFRCARCRRLVGWCFGCAGDDGCNGLCDDCTVEIWKKVSH